MTGAALQLAVGVWLARLLPPLDFGLVALAAIIVVFAKPVAELGLGSAVVQKPAITGRHLRAACTWSVVAGLALASIIWLAAPFAAGLAGDARIAAILRLLALSLPLRCARRRRRSAALTRDLDFRRLSIIEIAQLVVGVWRCGRRARRFRLGLWSLVWGAIAQSAAASVAQVLAVASFPASAGRQA